MKTTGLLSMVLLAAACVSEPPTNEGMEDWRYRRDTARIEAGEKFEKLKADCSRSGGAVVVNRTFSRRMRETPDDAALATCQRGASRVIY